MHIIVRPEQLYIITIIIIINVLAYEPYFKLANQLLQQCYIIACDDPMHHCVSRFPNTCKYCTQSRIRHIISLLIKIQLAHAIKLLPVVVFGNIFAHCSDVMVLRMGII